MTRHRSPHSLWARLWARRARALVRRSPHVTGAVERPHPRQRFVHDFELRGWLSPGGVVHVTANGHEICTLQADRPRPDLAASVPGEVHGFDTWVTVVGRKPSVG